MCLLCVCYVFVICLLYDCYMFVIYYVLKINTMLINNMLLKYNK